MNKITCVASTSHSRCLIISFLFLLFSIQLNAQYFVGSGYFKLTGEYGDIFKPAFEYQIGQHYYSSRNKFKFSAYIGYLDLKTRQDQYSSYAVSYNPNNPNSSTNVIVQQTIDYRGTKLYSLSFGSKYYFLEDDWSPFVGSDIKIYLGYLDTKADGAGISGDIGSNIGNFGTELKVGMNYSKIDNMQFEGSTGLYVSVPGNSSPPLKYWHISLQVYYFF